MSEQCFPIGRSSNILVQTVNDECLVYDLESNKAFCLNETSAKIWKLCDGTRSVKDLAADFASDARTNVNEDLIRLGLDQLGRNRLLNTDCGEIEAGTYGETRRDVIRKIGLSSMIALPIVYSLVAPTAVSAASCGNAGAACASPANCCLSINCGGPSSVCCGCVNPGQCLTQTACPSTTNCNPAGICAS